MKRFFALVLVILSLTATAYADTVDLSGMTLEELVQLQKEVEAAIVSFAKDTTFLAMNPDEIEQLAQSVLMLEVYDSKGNLIATGSGFVAINSSLLFTNYHVIEDAYKVIAISDDNQRYTIEEICSLDEERDLALLKMPEDSNIPALILATNYTPKRAESVVAIGSPIGFKNTVSIGNISAVYQEDGISYIHFTAPISHGSSGGALFNSEGNVIGITSAYYEEAQNLNIAIDSSEILNFFNKERAEALYRNLSVYSFAYAPNFYEGLAVAKKDDKYGFIDTTGKLVIPYQWDDAYGFSEGLAVVKKDGLWGFIDTTGKLVIPCQWYDAGLFHNGLAWVKANGKYGYIDTTGTLVIPRQWKNANNFSEGLAAVKKDGKWGFIDTTGKLVIPCQWDLNIASSFSEGLAAVRKDGKYGFIDTAGKLVIPLLWDYACPFSEGLAAVKKGNLYGYIDTTGKLVIPLLWDYADFFNEGLATVGMGGKYGFIDTSGKLVIPCQWDSTYGFSEGLAWVRKDGKWNAIDTNGNIVFSVQ